LGALLGQPGQNGPAFGHQARFAEVDGVGPILYHQAAHPHISNEQICPAAEYKNRRLMPPGQRYG
jgi:hypothetical protein